MEEDISDNHDLKGTWIVILITNKIELKSKYTMYIYKYM